MKTVIVAASLFTIAFSATSCTKDYDCTCTSLGSRNVYVETVRGQNRDKAAKSCAEVQDKTNAVTYPGVECSLD